MSFAFAWSVA